MLMEIVLTVASLLSSKPLFTSPLDRKDESKKYVDPLSTRVPHASVQRHTNLCRARESFSRARSDLLTDVQAYDSVISLRAKGEGQAAQRRYCEDVSPLPLFTLYSDPHPLEVVLTGRTEFHQRVDCPGYHFSPTRFHVGPKPNWVHRDFPSRIGEV